MVRLQLSTAGESHGPAEIAILSGVPAGLALERRGVDRELSRRQQGYGRGGRQRIEQDRVVFLAGVRHGRTTGAPLALQVENRDHPNWLETMSAEAPASAAPDPRAVRVPRPGHADLAGVAKYDLADARDVLERSSARATAARVAAGAVAKALLTTAGVTVRGRVLSIGPASGADDGRGSGVVDYRDPGAVDWDAVEASSCGVADAALEGEMRAAIDRARQAGVSLGGVFEVWAWGLPPGLGSYARAEDRLDGRLAGALMAIPAMKGVEVGIGFEAARRTGPEVHDTLHVEAGAGIARGSNRAGGLEGGVTNGMPVVLRVAMKPIPTMPAPLQSVDLQTLRPAQAHKERADVEAVPAARVVGEAEVALVLADALLEKFGGDTVADLAAAMQAYEARLRERGLWPSS